MNRWVNRLAAALFGLLLALALAEVGLRLAEPALATPLLPLKYDSEAIQALASGQHYLQFEADLGWLPTPAFERAVSRGVVYRHNQQGLRANREYSPAPDPGSRRLAAYGDSFTYCHNVDLGDCWTQRLERVLRNSEVLNFGVPGYAVDQAWLRYQRDGASWKPCAVLIGHMLENVNRVVNRFRPFYQPGTGISGAKPRYVLDEGRLGLLPNPARRPEDLIDPLWVETNLGPRDAWYFPGVFVANPLDRFESVRVARTALFQRRYDGAVGWTVSRAEQAYRPGTEGFEVLVAVLEQFAAQVQADGATPVVLVFPTELEVARQRDGAAKLHTPLLEALEQRGIATIDLTDAMGREARRTKLNDLVPGHYRPAGNAVVARELDNLLPRLIAPSCGQ